MKNVESLSGELRQAFIRLIAKYTGLEIREREQAVLTEKIFLRMKSLKLAIPEQYYFFLEETTIDTFREWRKFAILLTNTDSYFFRDQGQLNVLRNHIFPEIIHRNQNHKTIRICSAGCSSGEEPYSLAIVLKEIIPDLDQWNIVVFGIDINQEALKKAEIGIYTSWSLRSLNVEIKQRYFLEINEQYLIARQIKQMVKFLNLNLVKDRLPQSHSQLRDIDLIVCRNVFIYFEASAIAQVVDKFYHTLQPLGYLLTGHAELSGQNISQFQTQVFPESLIYQRL